MKMAMAFALARKDNERAITRAVLSLESGGVRLQEANIGELVIAEIYAELVALRKHTPVVVVIAGNTGCFGEHVAGSGHSSHHHDPTGPPEHEQPEVIEQEADWKKLLPVTRSLSGACAVVQRHATGAVDVLVEHDADAITGAVQDVFRKGNPRVAAGQYDLFIRRQPWIPASSGPPKTSVKFGRLSG